MELHTWSNSHVWNITCMHLHVLLHITTFWKMLLLASSSEVLHGHKLYLPIYGTDYNFIFTHVDTSGAMQYFACQMPKFPIGLPAFLIHDSSELCNSKFYVHSQTFRWLASSVIPTTNCMITGNIDGKTVAAIDFNLPNSTMILPKVFKH